MIRPLFFLLAFPLAHAATSIGISCEQFVVDGGAIEEVCAEHQTLGPDPVMVNDTVEYIGDYVDTYNILELDDSMTAEEIEAMPANYTDYLSGLIVEVTRFSAEGCRVTINGTECVNCEVCGDNSTSVSVDCSAIPGGRVVECEPVDNVFFPFEGYALADTSEEDGPGTNAPSSGGEGNGDGNGDMTPEESSSHRCMAALITVFVGAVGTILQL